MQNIQHIKEKDAVLVPLKDWEKMQKELIRLRKKINKEKFMNDLRNAIIDLEKDLAKEDYDPDQEMTGDELIQLLKNEQ